MARLIDELIAKAKGAPRRVALPEATDADTLRAARTVLDEGIAHPVLVGPADEVRAAAAEAGVDIAGIPESLIHCLNKLVGFALEQLHHLIECLVVVGLVVGKILQHSLFKGCTGCRIVVFLFCVFHFDFCF